MQSLASLPATSRGYPLAIIAIYRGFLDVPSWTYF